MAFGRGPRNGSQERGAVDSDQRLAALVQRGDREALERLVRRYLRPVHAVAASYLLHPQDVEDAAQETFLRALRAIHDCDLERAFAPWLYQIARNVARDHLAATARWRTDLLPETLESELPRPDVLLERSEIRARVDASLAQLPEQRRTAFYLADVEGYDTAEVARIMGLSPGTVRSHVHYARRALRAALAEQEERMKRTGG